MHSTLPQFDQNHFGEAPQEHLCLPIAPSRCWQALTTFVRPAVIVVILRVLLLTPTAVAQQAFTPTGNPGTGRYGHTLTLLADGKVLAAGGYDGNSVVLDSAEVYDPATDLWSTTSPMLGPRARHTATLLQNGKVLVAGGYDGSSHQLATAELYDPVSQTWSATGTLLFTTSYHSAVQLNNGKVLVAAGVRPGTGSASGTDVAELYDPQSGTWSPTGSLAIGRYTQAAVLLLDGKVLVAGGQAQGGSAGNAATSAELYDPALGTWSATGSMLAQRWQDFDLTLLSGGTVLVAGGNDAGLAIAEAEIYDPLTKQWSSVAPLPEKRALSTTTLMLDGRVFVAGGTSLFASQGNLNTATIFDSVTATWSSVAATMAQPRTAHTAVRLLDGRVLLTGGFTGAGPLDGTAELFSSGPPLVPSLALTVTGPAALSLVNGQYQPNPFSVVATVLNNGGAAVQNIQLTLYPAEGLSLTAGPLTRTINSLSPGQQQQVTWNLDAAGQIQQTTLSYFVSTIASNAAGKSVGGQVFLPGGAVSIQSVSPATGGNTGSLTAQVFGGGFLPGATAKLTLTGQPDIVGTDVTPSADGFSLAVTFDLTGQTLGAWDLVVMNTSATSATLQNAITVEATRAADVWVETLGHPFVKLDKPQLYTILYGNRGNVDANFVSVWVAFPQYLTWNLSNSPQPTSSILTADGNVLLLFDVPLVSPGSLGTIRFLLSTPPPVGRLFRIWSWTKPIVQ